MNIPPKARGRMRLLVASASSFTSFAVLVIAFAGSAVTVRAQNNPSGEGVVFPSGEIEFICGPQLRAGSYLNPAPFFDDNAFAKGLEHGEAFPASPASYENYDNRNYYDQALVQYINYYRTGDPRFLTYARKISDSWWLHPAIAQGANRGFIGGNGLAPRGVSLGGLMLRAMDGRPEMWPWITDYTRFMFEQWVGLRENYDGLYYGVRDPGYMLLYAAWLARVHPDPAVRQELRLKTANAAANYYARLQYPDGTWRWEDADYWRGKGMQAFHVGILLEGLVATHRLVEGDPAYAGQSAKIKTAITKGVEGIYHQAYRTGLISDLPSLRWRGMWYLNFAEGCESGCGANVINNDTNGIRDVRQLNGTVIHAFGYAYLLTGDPKFKTWGDEVFDATYGRNDAFFAYGLADYTAKEYNQSYRAGGHYLAWRLGNGSISPAPSPTLTPVYGRVNVALASNGGVASSSSTQSAGYAASGAIDGQRTGANWSAGGGWNDATPGTFPDALEVAFGGARTIDEVDIFSVQDNYLSPAEPTAAMTFTRYGLKSFAVQYWDGAQWLPVPGGQVAGNNLVWRKVTFAPLVTTRVRVMVTDAADHLWSRVAEVEVYTPGAPPPTPTPTPTPTPAPTSGAETVWAEDAAPAGAVLAGDGEGWNWAGANPAPFSGTLAHQSNAGGGMHQHYFYGAADTLTVNAGDTLFAYVYLDPANVPSEVMLQWNDGNWNHRAYWGANLIPFGADGTESRRFMGPLPAAGQWVRLEVPARLVGLEGRVIDGAAFTLFGGRALWDRWGKASAAAPSPTPTPGARVNVALASSGARARSSSDHPSGQHPVGAVIDGDRRGVNWASGGGWHDATQDTYPDWVDVDFGASRTISEIDIYTLQDNYASPVEPTDALTFSRYGVTDFRLEYFDEDGALWVIVPGGVVTGNRSVWRQFTFAPITTSRIRVVVYKSLSSYSRLVEIEAYANKSAPVQPAYLPGGNTPKRLGYRQKRLLRSSTQLKPPTSSKSGRAK